LSKDLITNIKDDHPLALFLSMLGSPESKRQYPKRLQNFFTFLGLQGDIQDQALFFVKQFKNKDSDGEDLERQLLRFANYQKERVAKDEISASTVPNYFKAIKLFCQANRISKNIEWNLVSKAMPRGLNASDDRAPKLEEIQKLLEFPDRRIKPLVLTLVSSGIRIDAFETLKWKHITPKNDQKNNDLIAAKILVYAGDREQYYSFLTSEAYNALKEWMDYRLACGENITKESFVMRDIWQTGDLEGAASPIQLNQSAITRLLNRAWQAQKIRPMLPKGVRRHEFKTAHGFRKYFKTQAEQARIPSIKIELFMGHSLGVSDSYVRFTEEQMLEDYLKIIDYVTVNQTIVLINKSLKKQEETIHKSLKEMEERHKTEINTIHENYGQKISELISDKQKYESTISELTSSTIEAKKFVKETIEQMKGLDKNMKETTDMVYILKNEHELAGELISSFDTSTLVAHFKEQINNNPKIRKQFIDFIRNRRRNLTHEEKTMLDFLSNVSNKFP
jgi:integrase